MKEGLLFAPQIIHDLLDMFYLARSQAGHIKHMHGICALCIPAQQIICADMEMVRDPDDHLHGRHDVVILPITDTLLLHTEFFRELDLTQFL